jgi:hypothetical protein
MSGQTVKVISAPNASDAAAATYTIDATSVINRTPVDPNYPDSIVFSDGVVKIDGLGGPYGGTDATNFSYINHELYIDSRGGLGGVLLAIPFDDQSPAIPGQHLEVSSLGSSLYVTEGTLHEPAGATLLPGGADQPSAIPPSQAPFLVASGGNSGPQAGTAYTGPVSGITTQLITGSDAPTTVDALVLGVFIHTGAGNDAVALRGGTNVVDAGTGSNFLTAGGGFDTFFLDARNIPAAGSAAGPVPGAIWDTIQNIVSGDAATIFGIGPGTALDWQKNEGAVGHTGLTLHANLPNGSEASLTLAGIDSKAGLSLSYGSVGGSPYLYVKLA